LSNTEGSEGRGKKSGGKTGARGRDEGGRSLEQSIPASAKGHGRTGGKKKKDQASYSEIAEKKSAVWVKQSGRGGIPTGKGGKRRLRGGGENLQL